MSDKFRRRDFLRTALAGAGALVCTNNGLAIVNGALAAPAGSLQCDLTQYKKTPGLTATVVDNALTVTWQGEKNEELRMRMAISGGTPTIQDLAVRREGAEWIT